jgi:L-asparaginase
VAADPAARGLGALVVLNDEVHAARFVRKGHAALPSAFASPLTGPLGVVAEGRLRLYLRPAPTPRLPMGAGDPPQVALLRATMGDDLRLADALPGMGYAGAVIEGMGAGHLPAAAVDRAAALAARMPVVLAARTLAAPGFEATYGYPGGEMDLLARGLIAAGCLDGLKARVLLSLALWTGVAPAAAFAPYR